MGKDLKDKIKIAFIGNMNNNHFAISRFLRDVGFDCELLLFNIEQDHFHPKTDTYSLDYNSWVRRLEWGTAISFLNTKNEVIINDLNKYDILIGCGIAPAFCMKANLSLDIFIPYGSDIFEETLYRVASPKYLARLWSTVYFHRKGLKKVKICHMPLGIELYENQIKKYLYNSERWFEPIPLVYAPEYSSNLITDNSKKTHWAHEFLEIRSKVELMVFAHGRHFWGDSNNPNSKGNDILIQGWAKFCNRQPNLSKKLILVEYGLHVGKSKDLIAELGIEDTIQWFPSMFRKDLMPGIQCADIVAAEFVHTWLTGGVIFEALVAGKPLLMFSKEHIDSNKAKSLFPIYNALSHEDVCNRLEEYCTNPEQGKKMGMEGQIWYKENAIGKSIDKYVEYFDRRAKELGKVTY